MDLRVTFDWALDGPAWPEPLGQADFAFGEVWVGPLGLLDLLETRLGLGGRSETTLQRACRLAPRLKDRAGYWRQSYDKDPLGTCRRLLRERDDLRLLGWTGQAVSPRLAELQAATAETSPGVPDRLEAIRRALPARSTGIESVISYTVLAHLPPLWRAIFHLLRRAGVAVEERVTKTAATQGDLSGSREPGFTPTGDGRLCLLRRHGPLDVADEVAAALAAFDSLDGVVVIGADTILDQALARHGLPRVGGHAGPPASSRLLSWVLKAAFHPMEMGDLHALVVADPGPIPRRIAWRLTDALCQYPGRRTDEWNQAVAEGLSRIEEDKRSEVEQRVTQLLMPVCSRDERLPLMSLRPRLDILDAWARARAPYVPSLLDLSQRIRTFREAAELTGENALSYRQLQRLHSDLGEPSWTWEPAHAGLAHVARPGAILAPARTIIWWNFSRESAIRPERLRLSRADREGLRAAEIEPPDPTLALATLDTAWRRPLLLAQQSLVLACPFTDTSGEANHPHPLWDEITANLVDQRDARRLESDRIAYPSAARLVAVAPRPLVTAAPTVKVASALTLREVESPSSIEHLLACSVSWTLKYRAQLKPGLSAGPLPPGPLVYGKLAHWLLARVLGQPTGSADDTARLAAALFESECDNLCEDLALPQHQPARATVRRAVVESARELANLARKHRAQGVQTEIEGQTSILGQTIAGRMDLVWNEPPVVLDLKWGMTGPKEKLKTGTPIQLAAYAAMRGSEARSVETGYFILQTQDLLSEPEGRLATDARKRGAYPAPQIWEAALAGLRRSRDALAAGKLEAPRATGNELKPALTPAGLQLEPPCRYCSFARLCGLRGAR